MCPTCHNILGLVRWRCCSLVCGRPDMFCRSNLRDMNFLWWTLGEKAQRAEGQVGILPLQSSCKARRTDWEPRQAIETEIGWHRHRSHCRLFVVNLGSRGKECFCRPLPKTRIQIQPRWICHCLLTHLIQHCLRWLFSALLWLSTMVQQEGHKNLGCLPVSLAARKATQVSTTSCSSLKPLLTSLRDCSLQASPIPLLLRKTTISAWWAVAFLALPIPSSQERTLTRFFVKP